MLNQHIPNCIFLVKLTDLDPSMRRLLMQAKVTEEGLKDKDTAEAVDCIINQFGGLKVVQRELRNRGTLSWELFCSFYVAVVVFIKSASCASKVKPDLLSHCSGIFDRPGVSNIAKSCRSVHLPRSGERASAAGPLHQRHTMPQSHSPLDSSPSTSSSWPREDQKERKFQSCKSTRRHAVTVQ